MIDRIREISGCDPYRCMSCGKCSAACPSFEEMDIKPHQFASYITAGKFDELMQANSVWKCVSCFACIERCPRSVQPGRLIDAVRQLRVRPRGGDRLLPQDIPEKLDPGTPQQLLVSAFRRYKR